MPIIWQEEMSVKNKNIDDEHKYLFCLINSTEIALKLEKNGEILRSIVQQLEEYTAQHFKNEEKIQYKIKYPHYLEHKIEHQKILDQIAALKAALFKDSGGPSSEKGQASSSVEDILAGEMENPTCKKSNYDDLLDFEDDSVDKKDNDLEHQVTILLRRWVLEHVLQTDRKMTKYLATLPKNFL